MKIYLETKECEDVFLDALCNGLSYVRGYGLELFLDDQAYSQAKQSLKDAAPNDVICYEDVLMEVLRQGGSLTLRDLEGDEPDATITITDVYDRMSLVPANNLIAVLQESGDAYDADIVLQTVFLKEVIYG